MLKENKVTRYFLYAIGEIFLVMVGILLALQVSTWNKERMAKKKERILLEELNQEFKENKAQLEFVLIYHNKSMASAEAIISEFPIDVETLDLDSVQLKASDLGFRYTFNPSQGIINSLVNTSSFDLISDPALRKLLVRWNDVLSDYQEEEQVAAQTLIDHFMPFFYKNLSWADIHDERVNLNFLVSLQYENLVRLRRNDLRDILGSGDGVNELTMIQETIDRIIELSITKE